MILLSVNVNKLATLRNSRGGKLPDVVQVARDCLKFGANGITVHPRPDGRHIRRQDVFDLKTMINLFNESANPDAYREFNIEGYPSEHFINLVEEIRPDQVTLVPDPPEALTSNAGWKIDKHRQFLKEVSERFKAIGVRISLFVDPYDVDDKFLNELVFIAPDRVELYTEMFASSFQTENQPNVIEIYRLAGEKLADLKIGINAGHDLNLNNIGVLRQELPYLAEVSIGHALFCEAIYLGLQETVSQYLETLQR